MIEYKGRPVPWITRWTDEVPTLSFSVRQVAIGGDPTPRLQAFYPNDPGSHQEGLVLWQVDGLTRGGEPQWSQVNTMRQRAAMRKCLCQVCGNRMPDGPIRWLMHTTNDITITDNGDAITTNPPTCENCIDIALAKCPHLLKYGHRFAIVNDHDMWGVYGSWVRLEEDGTITQGENQQNKHFAYDLGVAPNIAVVARQQAVRLIDWTYEGES